MGEEDGHAVPPEVLARYAFGALDRAAVPTVEHHLAVCDRCLTSATDLRTAANVLDEADPGGSIGALLPSRAVRGRHSPPLPSDDIGSTRPRVSTFSARRSPSGAARGRHRLRGWTLTAAAAVTVVGVSFAVLHDGGQPAVPPVKLTLVASAAAAERGVSFSVTVNGHDHGSTVRLNVSGLRTGLRYRLYVTTVAGVTHPIRDWSGAAGPQVVVGESFVPVDAFRSVAIGLVDGEIVITATTATGATPNN